MNVKILVVIISVFNLFSLSANAQNIVFVPEYSTQTVDSLQASPAIQRIYSAQPNAGNPQFIQQDNVFVANSDFVDNSQTAAPAPVNAAAPTPQEPSPAPSVQPAETPDVIDDVSLQDEEDNPRRNIEYYMRRLILTAEQISSARTIRNANRMRKREIKREMSRLRVEEKTVDNNSLSEFEALLDEQQKELFNRIKNGEDINQRTMRGSPAVNPPAEGQN